MILPQTLSRSSSGALTLCLEPGPWSLVQSFILQCVYLKRKKVCCGGIQRVGGWHTSRKSILEVLECLIIAESDRESVQASVKLLLYFSFSLDRGWETLMIEMVIKFWSPLPRGLIANPHAHHHYSVSRSCSWLLYWCFSYFRCFMVFGYKEQNCCWTETRGPCFLSSAH